jgi:UDP-N-acetylglucosamine acyltransferase
MAASIHPSAVVDPAARLGEGVTVGPFCLVGPQVSLADGVTLESHAVLRGDVAVGPRTRIYPFVTIGYEPQDVSYQGEESRIEIGADNLIRENVTINPGTARGRRLTRIGDGCFLMVGSHVAHDCTLGDGVIMANLATLAGHVTVGSHVILGGLCAIHQFVRVGDFAFVGGMAGVERDVIPYGMVMGERARLAGLNLVGLKRRGFARADIHRMRAAFDRLFHGEQEWRGRLDAVEREHGDLEAVRRILDFLAVDSRRKILHPKFEDAV